ncbi:Replication factor A protein 1 [Castilleja foliolosa]|uniref:Replication factor A protein 1 n=1 Tax=Castilleja foliolosa TaxID=1961234 RepID=A0ABD3B7R6_9LAMI
MDYISISDLKQDSGSSPIKVRVSRKWDVYSNQGMFISTEFVLVDEEANSIHAIIWPSNARQIKDKLNEGLIYFINKFTVLPNKAKYRIIVKNDLMLELNAGTTVKMAKEENKNIPLHAFEFVELEKLEPSVDEHLLDVIGVLSAVGDVQEQNFRGSVVKILDLEIVNMTGTVGRGWILKFSFVVFPTETKLLWGYKVRVRLWGKFADNFKGIWSSKSKDVNIGIFTSMSVKKFATVQCSTNSGNYADIIGVEGQFSLDFIRPQVKSIEIVELLKLGREDRDTETTYLFTGKIIDVLTRKMWFRLELTVEDGTAKTNIIVFDEGVEFMVKAKAVDLASQEQDAETDNVLLPEQIKNILGSEYSFYTKPSTFIEDKSFGIFVSIKVTRAKVIDTLAVTDISEKQKTQSSKRAGKLDSNVEQTIDDSSTPTQVQEKQKNIQGTQHKLLELIWKDNKKIISENKNLCSSYF